MSQFSGSQAPEQFRRNAGLGGTPRMGIESLNAPGTVADLNTNTPLSIAAQEINQAMAGFGQLAGRVGNMIERDSAERMAVIDEQNRYAAMNRQEMKREMERQAAERQRLADKEAAKAEKAMEGLGVRSGRSFGGLAANDILAGKITRQPNESLDDAVNRVVLSYMGDMVQEEGPARDAAYNTAFNTVQSAFLNQEADLAAQAKGTLTQALVDRASEVKSSGEAAAIMQQYKDLYPGEDPLKATSRLVIAPMLDAAKAGNEAGYKAFREYLGDNFKDEQATAELMLTKFKEDEQNQRANAAEGAILRELTNPNATSASLDAVYNEFSPVLSDRSRLQFMEKIETVKNEQRRNVLKQLDDVEVQGVTNEMTRAYEADILTGNLTDRNGTIEVPLPSGKTQTINKSEVFDQTFGTIMARIAADPNTPPAQKLSQQVTIATRMGYEFKPWKAAIQQAAIAGMNADPEARKNTAAMVPAIDLFRQINVVNPRYAQNLAGGEQSAQFLKDVSDGMDRGLNIEQSVANAYTIATAPLSLDTKDAPALITDSLDSLLSGIPGADAAIRTQVMKDAMFAARSTGDFKTAVEKAAADAQTRFGKVNGIPTQMPHSLSVGEPYFDALADELKNVGIRSYGQVNPETAYFRTDPTTGVAMLYDKEGHKPVRYDLKDRNGNVYQSVTPVFTLDQYFEWKANRPKVVVTPNIPSPRGQIKE